LHETGQDRIVLSEIPAQMDGRHRLPKPFRKVPTHWFGNLFGTVLDQNELQRMSFKNFRDLLDEFANGATAVVNWNYQR